MKRAGAVIVWAALGGAIVSCGQPARAPITQEELVRRTQELVDALASGDKAPWQKYLADGALIFDEKGRDMDKPAMLKDVAPLPPGYSGTIRVARAKSRIDVDTAILSYDLDETETVFGQNLTARYHGTDTWMRHGGQWLLVASQMLRYYEDPAPGKVDERSYPDYVGTYALGPESAIVVSFDGHTLYAQRDGRPRDVLVPEAPDLFFRKGVEGRRLFHRGDDGRVDALIDRRNNEDIVWKKTDG